MAAMLIMNMAMIVIMVVMIVAVMAVVMSVIMMMRRRHCRLRLQRAHKAAALGPDQAGAEGRDQGVACDLDRLLRGAHRLGGGTEQPGENRNQRHGHQRLQ